ncbi:MAG: flagellar motor switch protein FliN, partial [SAR324 cluster bacterium]|nr:flagellar motor switch protein FliN [SAR324 cluster bacterium]
DDELYSVITPASSVASAISAARGEEVDDSSLHEIDFIHDVPLRLSVEIGNTLLSVREILALNTGKVIEFTKVVGEPMDITVSGRLMARGEIVVVNERYGVRISEVTRPDETETAAKELSGE